MFQPNKTFNDTLNEVFKSSPFRGFSTRLLEELQSDAIRLDIPAGGTIYTQEASPRCGLVVSGLFRVYMSSPDGRQVTVRYARGGDVLGLAAIAGGPAPVGVQALTNSTVVMLNLHTLKRSGQTEPEVGWLIAEEISHRLYEVLEILAGNTFGNLRQRLARHLLDIAASNSQFNSVLVAHITQQELADAVGSVRPVVARLIKELKVEGLIDTGGSTGEGITILRPIELLNQTWSR